MSEKRVYRRRENGIDWYDASKGDVLRHNVKDVVTKLYYDAIDERWCKKKSKKVFLDDGEVVLFDFTFYGLDKLKNSFGVKLYEKVGVFLTRQYRLQLFRGKDIDRQFVYWSFDDLEDILGYKCVHVLTKLIELGLIDVQVEKSKYDKGKFTRLIRLKNGFMGANDETYKISSIKNKTYEEIVKAFYKKFQISDEAILKSIEETLCSSALILKDKQFVFNEIFNDRILKDISCLENKYARAEDIKSAKDRQENKDEFRARYFVFLERYLNGVVELQSMKTDEEKRAYLEVKVQSFGKRISHAFSNMPKEFRKNLKIDGEDVVEIDIKSSQASFLYIIIQNWFKGKYRDKDKISIPYFFKFRFNIISSVHGFDLYKYMANKIYGLGWIKSNPKARTEMKNLFYKLIFGNPAYSIKGIPRREIVSDLFGFEMFEFLESLSLEDLGLEVDQKYKNLSALLQREEANFMRSVMKKLESKKIMFIPVYDSLIVKQSNAEQVKKLFAQTINEFNFDGILSLS